MNQEDCFHLGVKGLIRNVQGQFLLLKRDHPIKKIYWDLPGGRLQKGESLTETLLREIEEETGLKEMHPILPFTTVVSNIRIPLKTGDVGLIFSIYICDIASPFQPRLSEEHIDYGWFPLAETVQKLQSQYPLEFIEKLELL